MVKKKKKKKENWHVNDDNIFISELVRTKTYSKYLIGYLNKVIRELVLIMPKTKDMFRHPTSEVKDGDKHKKDNLMSFYIDDKKLLEKYKTIWTKIEESKVLNYIFTSL